ncbi:A24 family peptidase [Nocardioides sp.]|uniref:A24 family peptidase n=1 Tax=Nocardioides sp. TaxID=35761 RepID=UPI002CE6BEF7|nr:A24 family peptidase [Nocardioides sp.]HVX54716.1 A24 family peptidase [Nocardioides sp.]
MSSAAPAMALLAAVLGAGVPALVARLPEPVEHDAPPEEGPKEPYAVLGRRRWLLPTAALASAAIALLIGARLGDDRVAWVMAVLAPVLVLLAVVDWRTRLLPRVVVLPATGVLLLLVLAEWVATRDAAVLVRAVAAMLVARSFFWVLWFVRRAGMGFGDVRLAALLGLVLGRVGWNPWLIGLYGGLLLFGLFGITLMLVRRDRSTLKRAYPFGPFMIAGAVLGILLGGSVHVVA